MKLLSRLLSIFKFGSNGKPPVKEVPSTIKSTPHGGASRAQVSTAPRMTPPRATQNTASATASVEMKFFEDGRAEMSLDIGGKRKFRDVFKSALPDGTHAKAYEGVHFRTRRSTTIAVIFRNRGHADLMVSTERNRQQYGTSFPVNCDHIEISREAFYNLVDGLKNVDRAKVTLKIGGLENTHAAVRAAAARRLREQEDERLRQEENRRRRQRDEEDERRRRDDDWHVHQSSRSKSDDEPTFRGAGGSSGGAGASGSWDDTPSDVTARQNLAGLGYVIGSGMLNPKDESKSDRTTTGSDFPASSEWTSGPASTERTEWSTGSETASSNDWSSGPTTEDRNDDYVPSGGGYDR